MNGHSFGGVTSVASAIRDDRIKVTLSLDPWFMPISRNDFSKYNLGASKPMQAIISENFFNFENNAYDFTKVRNEFLASNKAEGNRRIEVIKMLGHGHGNMNDLGVIKPVLNRMIRGTGPLTWTGSEQGRMYAVYAQL